MRSSPRTEREVREVKRLVLENAGNPESVILIGADGKPAAMVLGDLRPEALTTHVLDLQRSTRWRALMYIGVREGTRTKVHHLSMASGEVFAMNAYEHTGTAFWCHPTLRVTRLLRDLRRME